MLRTRLTPLVLIAAVFGMGVQPAVAHHSYSMFDLKKTITVTGKVREFQWSNPHVFLEVTGSDGKGGTTNWSLEAGAPNILAKQGWKRSSFKPGDAVVVQVNPLRNGAAGGALVSVRSADGSLLKG
jgi:hypothetical protein